MFGCKLQHLRFTVFQPDQFNFVSSIVRDSSHMPLCMHKNTHSSDYCALIYYCCDRYAIGGLAGGESKDSFWRVVAQCTAALPEDKPRYVMVQIPFIISTSILQTSEILVNWVVIFIFFRVTIFSHIFSGCWLSTGHCGLQCFRC